MDQGKKVLSAKDICSIIKQCANSGVSLFRYGELVFSIGTSSNQEEAVSDDQTSVTFPENPPLKTENMKFQDMNAPEPLNEFDFDYLATIDPVRFEKIQSGEEKIGEEVHE